MKPILTKSTVGFALALLVLGPDRALPQEDYGMVLSFESPELTGWTGGPRETLSQDSLVEYIAQAADADVLVVDIRNYPSEFVVFALGGRLVTEPTEFARFTRGDGSNPGAFLWTPAVRLEPLEPRFPGTAVILLDEVSLSQAEYTAMALRAAPTAVVVGSTTSGADGNVSSIPLPGGINSMISGIGVFYPNRTPTQRVGIVPDLEVRPTIAGVRSGRDEVLEEGVGYVLGREFRLPAR